MKYHVIVFGCQMNISDAERVSAVLEGPNGYPGYKKTSNINEANLVVIVMCSVRQSAVDRVFGLAEKFKKMKKPPKTILTGCILKKDKKTFSGLFDYVINISELVNSKRTSQAILHGSPAGEKLPRIERVSAGERVLAENLPASVKARAYVPISNGCNNFCTYCVVPYTRGRLICIDHKKIIEDVKKMLNPTSPRLRGAREIWLLGQNVNDYSSPSNKSIDFPKLLELINNLPGNFKIYFMSPNPKNFSDKLIKTMAQCQKFSKYLNLPIQSGDNEILKKMNRPYTAEKYLALVKKIRKEVPDINLSTDVIVGFPGETKKQFNNTAKLFRKIKFNIAYINKYSPRYGTASSKMEDDVLWEEKKRREKILMDIIYGKKPADRQAGSKLIVILGVTASGKTGLSIKLAKKYNGEVVSADSRQVYKGMDIGSGKVTKKEMQGIPHHLLDVANPRNKFSVAQYQKLALDVIKNIQSKNKIPFLVGGTGFYIQSVVDGVVIPEVKPNWKLREKLSLKPLPELVKQLTKLDPVRACNIDQNNPRRVIRALEIVLTLKHPVPCISPNKSNLETLILGMNKNMAELKKLIKKRLIRRLKQGMVEEVGKLHLPAGGHGKNGLSWKRLEEFGLEYRLVAQYLQDKITYQEMIDKIQKESEHYAKRQITWFKRDKRILWIKSEKQAQSLVKKFLK